MVAKAVVMTVSPAWAVSHINLKITGVQRVTVDLVSVDAPKGIINITVTGISSVGPTPANMPNGDTTLEAIYTFDNTVVGQAQAIVVIPASVGTPHNPLSGQVNGVNMCMDATTSPAMQNIPPGDVFLGTSYSQWIQIAVWDQFGKTLDSCYNGCMVYEDIPVYGVVAINQRINGGIYSDPVGSSPASPPPSIVGANSVNAQLWPTAPKVPLGDSGPNASNPTVVIAGSTLNPSVQGRSFTTKSPDIVNVTWP